MVAIFIQNKIQKVKSKTKNRIGSTDIDDQNYNDAKKNLGNSFELRPICRFGCIENRNRNSACTLAEHHIQLTIVSGISDNFSSSISGNSLKYSL